MPPGIRAASRGDRRVEQRERARHHGLVSGQIRNLVRRTWLFTTAPESYMSAVIPSEMPLRTVQTRGHARPAPPCRSCRFALGDGVERKHQVGGIAGQLLEVGEVGKVLAVALVARTVGDRLRGSSASRTFMQKFATVEKPSSDITAAAGSTLSCSSRVELL